MYEEINGSRKSIGDVDVLYHDGLYHLFHLVLPNHDFIAHAVSTDAIRWRKVNNALFIGNPGSWDDLMLWTVHVSRDPFQPGRWRMFYTGLSSRDHGKVQRIGLATSTDLFHWHKSPVNWQDLRGELDPPAVQQARLLSESVLYPDQYAEYDPHSCFPLEADPRFYESSLSEGRSWVSFRDPYYYHDGQRGWLLASARTKTGPVVRRGCVAWIEERSASQYVAHPPLYHPRLYDDVEVPSLLEIDGDHYLIGSIREDAKIRYWHTDRLGNSWQAYHDNVLLAQGNYAGRICQDDRGWLLWNFYSLDMRDRTVENFMPPPKRLVKSKSGMLRAVAFEGLQAYHVAPIDVRCIQPLIDGGTPLHEVCHTDGGELDLAYEGGLQVFAFAPKLNHFQMSTTLQMRGSGKCGFVFRMDRNTRDGYYLSLDTRKQIAQLRAWGTGAEGSGEHMMQFQALQAGFWYSERVGEADVVLVQFGSYIELTINGRVILSLVDRRFEEGHLGVYLESAEVRLINTKLIQLRSPAQEPDHLVGG